MLDSCVLHLSESGVKKKNIKIFRVSGAYEIPPVLAKALRSRRYDACICIACIIKGKTDHYRHVSDHANDAISKLAIKYEAVVSNAIITCDNLTEAIERAGSKLGNKGKDAAEAALSTLKILDNM